MGCLFGPVLSKRLGKSLGLDVVPHKICNFDCVYCECGKTTAKINRRGRFIKLDRLIDEVESYISVFGDTDFDVITVTGSGEPTLEMQLKSIIEYLQKRINKPIAVLTNASLMMDLEVQEALSLADVVLPSLDAVSPDIFQKVDQSDKSIKIENIISGLIDFRKHYPKVQLWLEILMVKGVNDDFDEIQRLKEVIALIQPHQVHVGTVTRPPAYTQTEPISESKLLEIQNFLWPENISPSFAESHQLLSEDECEGASAGGGFSHRGFLWEKPSPVDGAPPFDGRCLPLDELQVLKEDKVVAFQRVLDTLKRRPCPFEELKLSAKGMSAESLKNQLDLWIKQGLIQEIKKENKTFLIYCF